MNFETRAIHAGQEPDPSTGAAIIPIHLSSTFTCTGIGENKGYEYSRTGNPTRAALEECIASLEGGSFGLSYASGLAAIDAVISTLKPGDHVVSVDDVYGGTYRLFEKVYRPRGLEFSYITGHDLDQLKDALTPQTKLLWLETPTNPLLHVLDIKALSQIVRPYDILTAVDNTFASPYLQQPLSLGADVVVHSTTKYLGGHSDVIGGVVIVNDQTLYKKLQFYQNSVGAVPGPFEVWLTLRGIKTLAVRMTAHGVGAQKVAEFLQQHEYAQNVRYPGLPDHPQHAIAKQQMSGFGGMVTFEVAGGRIEVDKFVRALRVFSFAESLGGVESLACYPPEMTHGSFPLDIRIQRGITENLIRLSVGLEHTDDLVADLAQALRISQEA